ncbi:glycosyltransferase family 1 protein [Aquincola sp. MAHUQ-54]|uniref:Glycosyltransferase family 1 protein n=1 Tax=Aquincola agrisoli TaxID=3119538 RepID=A0AAW9QGZ4_9BURK
MAAAPEGFEQAASALAVDEFLPARRLLRIAVVTETYPPEVNGVASTIAQVVEGLRARQHAVQLVRPRQAADAPGEAQAEPRCEQVLMRGLPIPRYPHLKMGVPSRKALAALWALKRPDIVHIATEGPLGWSALQAARRLGLPVCSDFRTNFHAYSRHYGVGWLHRPIMAYLRRFHNRTRCTMVPTEALRGALEAAGFRGLRVVPRGVDTQRFDPACRSEALRATWGVRPGQPVALYVGRLAPEKNLDLLARAFEAMRRDAPALRLVLVGDGPMRRELQHRLPGAVFVGERRGDDLAAHYASGDLFLFPSLTETYGNVTPEAMASALPVLAFDEAAAGRLIRHGDNGLLAPPGDADSFVRQALRLVNDLPAARGLGRRAREAVCEHGWDRIVAQVEQIFLAELRSGPPLPSGLWRTTEAAGR